MKSLSKRTPNSPERKTAIFSIVNAAGLHARPAAEVVALAKKFPAKILLRKGEIEVSGKSMLGVLMLGARQGETLTIEVCGLRAAEALEALRQLFEKGFNE